MDEEEVPFLEKPHRRRRGGLSWRVTAPWVLVVLLSSYIVLNSLVPWSLRPVERRWTSSDFVSARTAIKSKDTTFTSSLDFIDPDHIFRVSDPSAQTYIGNASTEIDQAWDDLILPADIYITDEEATTLPKSAMDGLYRSSETGKFKVEIEVFHSLHCLNMIRKRIYGDSYPEMLTENARIHIDHCVESLRELIMCGGDMTPIPIEWSEAGERVNPNYAQRHSCRDFDALKTWTKARVENR